MKIISTERFIEEYKHVSFLKMAKKESQKRVHERLLAIHHLCSGKSRNEAAAIVGRSDEWPRAWVLKYHNGGYSMLTAKNHKGKKSYLSKKQEVELKAEILKVQDDRNGGRLTGSEIVTLIKKNIRSRIKEPASMTCLSALG